MNQKGIAIVTSIIILVVIMALGTGVLFLTNTNLKSSENVRSNAISEANAQSGMDVAALLLRESYIANSSTGFPTSLNLPSTSSYQLGSYQRTSSDQAIVKVLGKSASGGEFVAEAIVKMNDGPLSLPPAFAIGLASEGTVTVTGGASLYVDASVHGNTGINLGGTFATCGARDLAGNCTNPIVLSSPPVSIGSTSATCKLKKSTYSGACSNRAALVREPIVISPDYYVRRNKVADLNGDGTFSTLGFPVVSDCLGAVVALSLSNPASNQKYCINGNANITTSPLVLSNTTIIASGNITIPNTSTLTNVNVISLNGTVSFAGNITATNSRIFSEGSMTLGSSTTSILDWKGMNTIATKGNMTFNGANNKTNTTTDSGGVMATGLALIAGGNITFNGRNQADSYFATFVAGGTLTQNGKANFMGTISAKGALTFNGDFFIDSGLDTTNTDLMEESDPYLSTLVRR